MDAFSTFNGCAADGALSIGCMIETGACFAHAEVTTWLENDRSVRF